MAAGCLCSAFGSPMARLGPLGRVVACVAASPAATPSAPWVATFEDAAYLWGSANLGTIVSIHY
jgi:hypothetical protein